MWDAACTYIYVYSFFYDFFYVYSKAEFITAAAVVLKMH